MPSFGGAAVRAAMIAALVAVAPGSAPAQDFFQGKNISLYVGSSAGGAYDTYARLIARHYSRHIPGHPNVIVVDMPGAAGRKMIGYLYNVTPRDGTAIGTALSTPYFDPLMGEDSPFDATKLNWIGSEALVHQVYATPKDIVGKAAEAAKGK